MPLIFLSLQKKGKKKGEKESYSSIYDGHVPHCMFGSFSKQKTSISDCSQWNFAIRRKVKNLSLIWLGTLREIVYIYITHYSL